MRLGDWFVVERFRQALYYGHGMPDARLILFDRIDAEPHPWPCWPAQ